ncbi:MAG: 6-phosphogluconolactonase [Solirubrobacterales bacterium]|nr:6-phosphogluconolactonase [Solirubrobacterales bacterium]
MEILRHSDAEGAARRAAALMADPEIVHLALAGGSTPKTSYELLGGLRSDWSPVHLWYGDERCVPPEDEDSNHRMASRALEAPDATWHRMRGELGPEAAAAAYAEELAGVTLDLTLLGMGEDGHTASLFPGNAALDVDGIAVGVFGSPKPPPERVSLTLDFLNASRRIVLLVAGEGKAEALARVLEGPDPDVPSSLLDRSRLTIVADAAALGEAGGEA